MSFSRYEYAAAMQNTVLYTADGVLRYVDLWPLQAGQRQQVRRRSQARHVRPQGKTSHDPTESLWWKLTGMIKGQGEAQQVG
jgi:hypothetical protein